MEAEEPVSGVRFGSRGHEPSTHDQARAQARASSDAVMNAVPPGKRLVTVVCPWHGDGAIAVLTTRALLTRITKVPYPDHMGDVLAPCKECVDIGQFIWRIDMQLLRRAHRRVEDDIRAKPQGQRGGPLRRVSAFDLWNDGVKDLLQIKL